ncbi:filamentous hemagglutinin N-terminal domain-containing protein, partial [Klebsiella michiganensis]
MFKFKLSYVVLAAALSSTFVYADPTTYTHLSGVKVIDIEKPNAAGVSHNMYREFSVDSKGVVLNNSTSDLTHGTLGNIAKNNNLTNGSASVILNEVTSNRASSLNGFIEVAGQRADVVIANPNGISCSGCSFINTNKAILTTGKVTFSDTGAIASYDVTGGKLSIDKKGMDASNSYAVLLADAIAINGAVNAKNAIVGAGNFTFDNGSGAITSAGKSATALQYLYPEYSIDISNLGGIKANSITMVGNNLGFGVRNKGAIVANTSLSLTSFGSLTNEGSIASNGMMTQVVSAGNFKNTGNISSNNITLLNSLSSISNSGTISSTGNLLVNASGNIENTGKFKASTTLNVMTNGNLKTTYGSSLLSDNQLIVTAAGNIDNGGSTRSKNTTVTFGGDSLKVTGNIFGYDTLLVQAQKNEQMTSGEISNFGTTSGGNVTIKTNGTLALKKESFMEAADTLTTKSYLLNNEGY